MIPAIFVSHGAPTLAIEPSPAKDFLTALGRDLDTRFGRPRAVLAVSAHWETSRPTVGTTAQPDTIHDFRGFPDELHRMKYPVPGAVEVADEARGLLERAGGETDRDPRRGLDHGAWVPLRLMYPDAGVPVAQISVQPTLGPAHHHRLGSALRPLREHGVLVLGSGSITHNLRELLARPASELPYVTEFVDWIGERVEAGDVPALLDYRRRAPYATDNHPTDEHLLPLFAVVGAGSPGARPRRIHRSVTFGALRMDAYEAP
jgi:4,5-DOPA dioxygenase extradiol